MKASVRNGSLLALALAALSKGVAGDFIFKDRCYCGFINARDGRAARYEKHEYHFNQQHLTDQPAGPVLTLEKKCIYQGDVLSPCLESVDPRVEYDDKVEHCVEDELGNQFCWKHHARGGIHKAKEHYLINGDHGWTSEETDYNRRDLCNDICIAQFNLPELDPHFQDNGWTGNYVSEVPSHGYWYQGDSCTNKLPSNATIMFQPVTASAADHSLDVAAKYSMPSSLSSPPPLEPRDVKCPDGSAPINCIDPNNRDSWLCPKGSGFLTNPWPFCLLGDECPDGSDRLFGFCLAANDAQALAWASATLGFEPAVLAELITNSKTALNARALAEADDTSSALDPDHSEGLRCPPQHRGKPWLPWPLCWLRRCPDGSDRIFGECPGHGETGLEAIVAGLRQHAVLSDGPTAESIAIPQVGRRDRGARRA